jgi:hypothetical protein
VYRINKFGLIYGIELTALGNDYKPLSEYSSNCEKLNAQSSKYLKSLTLPDFRNQIGYTNDLTVIRRKDFEYPRDISNYELAVNVIPKEDPPLYASWWEE